MKLFLITDTGIDDSDTGALTMAVVRAEDEATARALVAKSERRKWWLKFGDCKELTTAGPAQILAAACVNP